MTHFDPALQLPGDFEAQVRMEIGILKGFGNYVLCGSHGVLYMQHWLCKSSRPWQINSNTTQRSMKALSRELCGYDDLVSTQTTPCVRTIKEPSLWGYAVLVFCFAFLSQYN